MGINTEYSTRRTRCIGRGPHLQWPWTGCSPGSIARRGHSPTPHTRHLERRSATRNPRPLCRDAAPPRREFACEDTSACVMRVPSGPSHAIGPTYALRTSHVPVPYKSPTTPLQADVSNPVTRPLSAWRLAICHSAYAQVKRSSTVMSSAGRTLSYTCTTEKTKKNKYRTTPHYNFTTPRIRKQAITQHHTVRMGSQASGKIEFGLAWTVMGRACQHSRHVPSSSATDAASR